MDKRSDEQKQPFFPIYRETAQLIDLLDAEQAGRLVKAAAAYLHYGDSEPGEISKDRRRASILQEWERKIDESRGSYRKRCEANRQNGQKGGRPAKPKEDTPAEPF